MNKTQKHPEKEENVVTKDLKAGKIILSKYWLHEILNILGLLKEASMDKHEHLVA